MKINRNSWHYNLYRWTYELMGRCPPAQTNLCQYVQRIFWVSFLHSFMYLCMGTIIVSLLGLVVVAEYLGWSKNTMEAAYGHGCFIVAAGILALYVMLDRKNNKTLALVGEWISAKKKGVCPVVSFDEP